MFIFAGLQPRVPQDDDDDSNKDDVFVKGTLPQESAAEIDSIPFVTRTEITSPSSRPPNGVAVQEGGFLHRGVGGSVRSLSESGGNGAEDDSLARQLVPATKSPVDDQDNGNTQVDLSTSRITSTTNGRHATRANQQRMRRNKLIPRAGKTMLTYDHFDIVGESYEARFPWQRDIAIQCELNGLPVDAELWRQQHKQGYPVDDGFEDVVYLPDPAVERTNGNTNGGNVKRVHSERPMKPIHKIERRTHSASSVEMAKFQDYTSKYGQQKSRTKRPQILPDIGMRSMADLNTETGDSRER